MEKQIKGLINGIYKNMIQFKNEKNFLIIEYWKNLIQLGDTISDFGGIIKIGIINNQLMIQHENPTITLEKLDFSKLNLSNIIMYFIQQNILFRLKSLKNTIESSFEGKIEIHENVTNGNSYLMINLFESVNNIISINWKTGKLIFESNFNGEEFISNKSQEYDNINKTIEYLYNMRRQIIYESYENSSKLLNLDSNIGKDEQDNDCLFIKYPIFKNVFILISTNGFIPIFRVVLYDKFITEVNNIKFLYQKFSNQKDSNSTLNIKHIIENSKRAILKFSLFQEISRLGIGLKKTHNGGSFYIECKNLRPNHFEIVINDKNWAVYLYETNPCFIKKGNYSGHINYTNCLTFNYEFDSFSSFYNDLKSIDKITRLAMECEKLNIPTSVLTHTKITINYGNNYSCDIVCLKGKLLIQLNPSHEMASLLLDYLQKTESIELFYKKLEKVSIPLLEFKKYNWYIIVRDLDEIRLFHNKHSFIVNFGDDLSIKTSSKVFEKKDRDCSLFIQSFYQMVSIQSIFELFQNVLKKYNLSFQRFDKEISLQFECEFKIRANEQNRGLEIKVRNFTQLENANFDEIIKDVNDETKIISLIQLLRLPFDVLKSLVMIPSKNSKSIIKILFSIPQDLSFSENVIKSLKQLPATGTPCIKCENGELNLIVRVMNEKRQYLDIPMFYKINEQKLEFKLWDDLLKLKGSYQPGKTYQRHLSKIQKESLKAFFNLLKELDIQEFKDL